MRTFKKGDIVKCMADHFSYAEYGVEYTVAHDQRKDSEMIDVNVDCDLHRQYNQRYFVLVKAVDEPVVVSPEQKDLLTLSYGGVTITLDPSIAFSRKFAEVFLDVAYAN